MLEGKALVVAVMMLTAAPLVVTDDGREIVSDVTNEVADLFIEEEKIAEDPNLNEVLDDAMEDCLTLEEWKRSDVTSKENYVKDEVERKDSESKKEESKKDDGSRNEDNKEDCITEAEYNRILESSEFSSTEGKDEEKPCYFLADIKEEMMKDKEGKDWDREHWNKEDKDWEKEDWDIVIEELAGACEEGDEESCEKLELVREKLAEDREEDEVNEEEQENGSRSGDGEESEDGTDEEEDNGEHSHTDDKADDHSHDDDKADDHNHVTDRYDENWEEIRAAIEELKVACEEGNEEACLELREMIAEMMEDHKGDWDREGKDWDGEGKDWDEACLTMEEWKKVFDNDRKEKGYGHKNNHEGMNIVKFMHTFEELDEEEISEIKQIIGMSDEEWDSMVLKLETKSMTKDDWKMVMEKMKLLFDYRMQEEREEMEAFRVQMTELGEACEAGDEDSCEELESLMEELENDFREDKEGECDKEHGNEEEHESEEEQTDEDESNEEDESEE